MKFQTVLNVFNSLTNGKYEEIHVVTNDTVSLNGSLIFVGPAIVNIVNQLKSGKKISNKKLDLIIKNVDSYYTYKFHIGYT